MQNEICVHLLKPHPKNEVYFSALPPGRYEEIKRSIGDNGIREPLKVLPDHTVVAGHQRLKIALELGLEKVPVVIADISADEAEYLLIAGNEERRQADNDPVRRAKRARFLAEYWGVRRGRGGKHSSGRLVGGLKTMADIAVAVGANANNMTRLLRLNDLIEPLQCLVSAGKLSHAAAYHVSYLSPGKQMSLLSDAGEAGICELSTEDARALRAGHGVAVHGRGGGALLGLPSVASNDRPVRNTRRSRSAGNPDVQLKEKQAGADALHTGVLESGKNRTQGVVGKPDPAVNAALKAAQKEVAELRVNLAVISQEKAAIEKCLLKSSTVDNPDASEIAKASGLKAEIERMEAEKRVLAREIERARDASTFSNIARAIFRELEKKEADFQHMSCQVKLEGMYWIEAERWLGLLDRYKRYVTDAMKAGKHGAPRSNGTVDRHPADLMDDVFVIDITSEN